MKNIHVLPTENYKQDYTTMRGEVLEVVRLGQLILNKETNQLSVNKSTQWAASCDTDVLVPHHIYISCDDEEIKEDDWFYDTIYESVFQWKSNKPKGEFQSKIILTTDQELISDGVQPIDDEFLEWFIKNPGCESVDVKRNYLGSKCLKCGFIENHDEVETEDCPKCHNTTYEHLYNNKIIIPQEEPKQDTYEEEYKKLFNL